MHPNLSDAELVAALRSVDPRRRETAFNKIYWRHQRDLYRYARRLAGHDLADEIVQDTMLAVWRLTCDRCDIEPRVLRLWLFGIIRHIARSARDRERRYGFPVEVDATVADVRGATAADVREDLRVLLDAASRLSPTNRVVVALMLADVPVRQAAAIRRVTPASEKVQRRRLRLALASALAASSAGQTSTIACYTR